MDAIKKLKFFSKLSLAVLFCTVLIVTGFFRLTSVQQAPYWKDLEISKITLNDIDGEFSIKNGKIYKNGNTINAWIDRGEFNRILKVALFYQWIKEDPLLFDPYIDQKEYGDSFQAYKNSMGIFLETIHGQKISPTDFLEKFGIASTQYKKFQDDISEKKALELLSAIRNTQEAYTQDAMDIEKSFQSSSDENKKIMFIGGITSTNSNIIIGDLKLIQKNGGLLSDEIKKRENCLLDSTRFCKRPLGNLLPPQAPSVENENPNILPNDILEIPDGAKLSGPYRVNSSCWNSRNYQWLYLVDYCRLYMNNLDKCPLIPYLADNRYFGTTSANSSYKDLFDAGVRVIPMGMTNGYACNDLQFRASLNAVDYFYQTYSSNKFFDNINLSSNTNNDFNKIFNDGKSIEKVFFDAKFPSQNSLEYLGKYYLYAYGNNMFNKNLNLKERDELLQRGMLATNKLVRLPSIIKLSSILLNRVETKVNGGKVKIQLLNSYTTSSEYSLLFLNFTPSVWRSPDKLHFLDFDNGRQGFYRTNIIQEFMDFNEARNRYGENNLLNWDKKYREFENEYF